MIEVLGQYVDIIHRKIYPARIIIENGKIQSIEEMESAPIRYIMPGFIDAHIHIESSMLPPSLFAREAVKFGTVATISDPHEIANVCGIDGVKYMIDDASLAPLKFHFGAPSCVPATSFETAGAIINADDVKELMQWDDIHYLSEVMNFPAVMKRDSEIMQKIQAAKDNNKPVDGHAPGLREEQVSQYFSAGISTDHECFTIEEAREKLAVGCKILIREGSAAKNFDALIPLFSESPKSLMFCSDDLHPDELLNGHINLLVKRAISLGYDRFDVLYAACIHPIQHYNMKVGYLNIGDDADFIIVEDLHAFGILETWINAKCIYRDGVINWNVQTPSLINNFNISEFNISQLRLAFPDIITNEMIRVIEAIDGQLITKEISYPLSHLHNDNQNNISDDILKMVVVNRYENNGGCKVGYIHRFNLKKGAIASTVGHDSHNIIATGVSDDMMHLAINTLIQHKGGICYVDENKTVILPLPIAGLMSNELPSLVSQSYQMISSLAKDAGCTLHAPFMTLSFMALPVIPTLKLTDQYLFNVDSFEPVSLIK